MSYYLINNKHRSSIRTDVIYNTRNKDSYVFYVDSPVKIKYKYGHSISWGCIILMEPVPIHSDSIRKIPFSEFDKLILWNDNMDIEGEPIFIKKECDFKTYRNIEDPSEDEGITLVDGAPRVNGLAILRYMIEKKTKLSNSISVFDASESTKTKIAYGTYLNRIGNSDLQHIILWDDEIDKEGDPVNSTVTEKHSHIGLLNKVASMCNISPEFLEDILISYIDFNYDESVNKKYSSLYECIDDMITNKHFSVSCYKYNGGHEIELSGIDKGYFVHIIINKRFIDDCRALIDILKDIRYRDRELGKLTRYVNDMLFNKEGDLMGAIVTAKPGTCYIQKLIDMAGKYNITTELLEDILATYIRYFNDFNIICDKSFSEYIAEVIAAKYPGIKVYLLNDIQLCGYIDDKHILIDLTNSFIDDCKDIIYLLKRYII